MTDSTSRSARLRLAACLAAGCLLAGPLLQGALEAQASTSFGLRPIYLRGSAHAWRLPIPLAQAELFDLAAEIGDGQGLTVTERDEAAGVMRLALENLKGSDLDTHCIYPIIDYVKWRPTDTFAGAQADAITKRFPGETAAQAGRQNGMVHISLRREKDGTYSVQSICSAFLRDWGVLEATSIGDVEKRFLETLMTRLGTPVEVPLPEPPKLEPSRADATRDMKVAQRCLQRCLPDNPCPGVYVHPESLELRCVGK